MEPCEKWAPGRALPAGECENCHFQRHEHLLHHQSRPNGLGLQIGQQEAAPVVEAVARNRPPVVYCRQCGAGMRLHDGVDDDSYACPSCGNAGPKSGAPIPAPKAKFEPFSQRGVQEMLVSAHEEQASDQIQVAEPEGETPNANDRREVQDESAPEPKRKARTRLKVAAEE